MNGYLHRKSKKPRKNNAYNLVFLAKALSLFAMLLITLTSASAQVEFRDSSGFDFYNELTLQSGDLNIENGNLTMNNNRILGLPEPNSSGEPLTYGGGSGEYVDRAGDSMTGDLDLQDNYLIGNAANLSFGGSNLEIGGGSIDLTDAQNIIMNGGSITSINQLAGQSGSAITIGSNLDFQDTYSLEGVAGIADCSANQVLSGDGSCKDFSEASSTLNETLIEGNSAGNNDINMNGNNVEEVNQITGSSGNQVKIASPGLDLQSNDINDVSCIGDNCP